MSDKKITFVDWLGVNMTPDFSIAPRVGKVVGAGLFLIALIVILMGLVGVIQLFGAMLGLGPYADDTTGAAIRNLGLFLFALFGSPFLVWRSMVAQKQVKVAEQSQITDRINKAVEGLGSVKSVKVYEQTPKYYLDDNGFREIDSEGEDLPMIDASGNQVYEQLAYEKTEPNLEVRLGAIYALERIAQDSFRDHLQIMEILAAYIRGNAPPIPAPNDWSQIAAYTPRSDLQAAITVIGRRSHSQLDLELQKKIRLDLSKSNLSKIDFSKGNYTAVSFAGSFFWGANFAYSILTGTQFYRANLNSVNFFEAQMTGTALDEAIINNPIPAAGDISKSITFAKIYGVTAVGADLRGINYLGNHREENLIFGSKDTKLHHELDFDRNLHKIHHQKAKELKDAGDISELEMLQNEYYSCNSFVDWYPFDSNEGTLLHYYRMFFQRLGLIGFPYIEN